MSMTPADSVRRVALAYEQAARSASGSNFLVTTMPKEESKTYQNCLEVYEWCGEHQVELPHYFELVFKQFNAEWCVRNFKRAYPPFGVASSLKVLLRVEAALAVPSPMREARDKTIEEVAATIRKHPKYNWEMIVSNVYGYLPMEMREAIREKLNRGGIENV